MFDDKLDYDDPVHFRLVHTSLEVVKPTKVFFMKDPAVPLIALLQRQAWVKLDGAMARPHEGGDHVVEMKSAHFDPEVLVLESAPAWPLAYFSSVGVGERFIHPDHVNPGGFHDGTAILLERIEPDDQGRNVEEVGEDHCLRGSEFRHVIAEADGVVLISHRR